AALKYMPYKEKDILPTYGVALINAGKYQESIEVLTKALSLVPSDELYYNRSLAYIGINNKDAAIADLRQALAINPNNQSAQIKLSEL
ncbi:MAG TPA: tetratricopeptide repeat protein, partial [Saprospiraceae bacterium]|nr:tetratricopeptide repeat protein [Saprospiraceae bacterium]